MLEEQGRNTLADLIKKALRFSGRLTANLGKKARQKVIKNITETGQKSVKQVFFSMLLYTLNSRLFIQKSEFTKGGL